MFEIVFLSTSNTKFQNEEEKLYFTRSAKQVSLQRRVYKLIV